MLDELQFLTCYVMCDEIGNFCFNPMYLDASLTERTVGTMQFAELRPRIPQSKFPVKQIELQTPSTNNPPAAPAVNISRRRSKASSGYRDSPDLFDSDLADADLMAAGLQRPLRFRLA